VKGDTVKTTPSLFARAYVHSVNWFLGVHRDVGVRGAVARAVISVLLLVDRKVAGGRLLVYWGKAVTIKEFEDSLAAAMSKLRQRHAMPDSFRREPLLH
jgi:hypothetical protein